MRNTIKISSLLATLLLISGEVLAAGLGRMSVASYLGQPLHAEIDLLSVPSEDLGTVEVKLAGPEAFLQAHIARSPALAGLRFDVEKLPNGQPVVRITSLSPITEPFVDMLVELNWSSGRVLREYTVLLDPPPAQKPAVEQAAMPLVAPVVGKEAVQAKGPAPAMKPATAGKPGPKEAGAKPKSYGPVKAGETLRGIAGKLLPPDVSLDMMLASLYHANPNAFLNHNMNLLKKGQVLSVPDRDSIMLMYSPHQANQLIHEQAAAWHELQNRIAEQAARTVAPEVKEKSAESGKIVQAKPQGAPAAPPESKDILKVSKGEPANKAAQEAGKHIHDLEEELAAKNQQLAESQSRVSQLEKTVQDLQHLADLKAQQAAAGAAPATGQPTPPAAEAPKPVVKPVVKPPVPPVKEAPGFFSTFLANPLYIVGALAALILAGLLWVFVISSRRRKGLSNFEQSVMTGGDQFKTSIFKTTAGQKAERETATQAGATTDFSRLGLGSIDTHEVDPIAEAEVYMAYGRDAQAEEILKEALAKEPGRHEIALKLLEIYAAREDTASFETLASELYANLGDPSNAMWQKAAEMGRKIDPANPLYRVYGEIPELEEGTAEAGLEAAAPGLPTETGEAAKGEMPEAVAPEERPSEAEEAAAESVLEEAGVEDMGLDFTPYKEAATVPAHEEEAAALSEFGELEMGFEPEPATEIPAFTPAVEGGPAAEGEAGMEFPAFGKAIEPELSNVEEINIAVPEPAALEEELGEPQPVEEIGELDLTPEPLELAGAETPPVELEAAAVEAVKGPVAEEEAVTLPDLDFSGIDLELSEAPAAPAEVAGPRAAPEIVAPSAIDPDLLEEVNTKLDLAKAYLEMGDKEGAREILDEVLKEGDSHQKQAANDLMAEIG